MNVSYHCDRCLKLKEDGTCSKTAFGNIQTCIDHEEFPNKPGCMYFDPTKYAAALTIAIT